MGAGFELTRLGTGAFGHVDAYIRVSNGVSPLPKPPKVCLLRTLCLVAEVDEHNACPQ